MVRSLTSYFFLKCGSWIPTTSFAKCNIFSIVKRIIYHTTRKRTFTCFYIITCQNLKHCRFYHGYGSYPWEASVWTKNDGFLFANRFAKTKSIVSLWCFFLYTCGCRIGYPDWTNMHTQSVQFAWANPIAKIWLEWFTFQVSMPVDLDVKKTGFVRNSSQMIPLKNRPCFQRWMREAIHPKHFTLEKNI